MAKEATMVDLEGYVEAIGRAFAVVEFTPDGTILSANARFLGAMGYALDEIRGHHHRMFVDDAHANSAEYVAFWAALQRGDYQQGEYLRVGKGGREVWIQASYNPVLDRAGAVSKVVKVATDVTRQKVENADYRGQIDAINKSQAVIEFDMDGTIRHANDNFLKAMGYALGEIRGRHHRMFVDGATADGAEYREFWAALQRGEYQQAEFRRVGKNGKDVWIQASYNPILDSRGRPFKVVKYATDVTDQVHANQRLQAGVADMLGVVAAAASGDLRRNVSTAGDDAVGRMGGGLQTFLVDLRGKVGEIRKNAVMLANASEELNAVSMNMTANAEETSTQSVVVSTAAEQVEQNVEQVQKGTRAVNDSARQIASSTSEAMAIAQTAVQLANTTNVTVGKLGTSSEEIGAVTRVITEIAQQTNLLALNARIEAARAGDAGRGFAVVAREVKELASRTREATLDIEKRIEAIQRDTREAVSAIRQIGDIINQVHEYSRKISDSVQGQAAATQQIATSVDEAARATRNITQGIAGVAEGATNTTAGASQSLEAARQLRTMAGHLQQLIETFQVA